MLAKTLDFSAGGGIIKAVSVDDCKKLLLNAKCY